MLIDMGIFLVKQAEGRRIHVSVTIKHLRLDKVSKICDGFSLSGIPSPISIPVIDNKQGEVPLFRRCRQFQGFVTGINIPIFKFQFQNPVQIFG